jgi:RNA 3'-terminal phosphate cyclase
MAISGGGTFRSLKPTAHTVTNADVIGRFLGVPITIEPERDDVYVVRVGSEVEGRLRPERGA